MLGRFMKYISLICTIILFSLLNISTATAQDQAMEADNAYSVDYLLRDGRKYDAVDYMNLQAAEKTLEEGYSHFTILEYKEYDARREFSKSSGLDRYKNVRPKRPRLHMDVTILGFNEAVDDDIMNAQDVIDEFKTKYSD